jgi:hypothetical protein
LPKTSTAKTRASSTGQGHTATNQINEHTPIIAAMGAGIPSSVLLSVPAVTHQAIKQSVNGIKQLAIMIFTPPIFLHIASEHMVTIHQKFGNAPLIAI